MTKIADRRRAPFGRAAILAATVGILSAPGAYAASDRVCDEASKTRLQALEVPVQELAVEGVDFPTKNLLETVDLSEIDIEALPPLLSLTPRVASLIDQVFSTYTSDEVQEAIPEQPTSPVADRVPVHPGITPAGTQSLPDADESKLIIPVLQEQMFRKDI